MTYIATLLGVVLTIAAGATGIAALILGWIARGESDCNGAPERDAGASDDDIDRASRSWDHGSFRAASVPDLETARQLNQVRMQQDAAQFRTIEANIPPVEIHG